MIYLHKAKTNRADLPMRVTRVRWLSLAALISYPVGAVTHLMGSMAGSTAISITGLVIVGVTLVCAAAIIGTGVQRIVGDRIEHLNEIEIGQRQSAYANAYRLFGVVMLTGAFYLGLASDQTDSGSLWMPSNFDQWAGVVWGIIVMIFILPAAFLSWTLPAEEIEDDS